MFFIVKTISLESPSLCIKKSFDLPQCQRFMGRCQSNFVVFWVPITVHPHHIKHTEALIKPVFKSSLLQVVESHVSTMGPYYIIYSQVYTANWWFETNRSMTSFRKWWMSIIAIYNVSIFSQVQFIFFIYWIYYIKPCALGIKWWGEKCLKHGSIISDFIQLFE